MKLILLDGSERSIKIKNNKYQVKPEHKCRSKLQYFCGEYLSHLAHNAAILEDWTIPGTRLSLDFFIPYLRIAVEIQGRQHDKYVPFFHGTIDNFIRQQERDQEKARFCELNEITLYLVRTESDVEEINI